MADRLCCKRKAFQRHRNTQDHHHAKVHSGGSRKPSPHLHRFRNSSDTNADWTTTRFVEDLAITIHALDRAAEFTARRASKWNPLVFTTQRALLVGDIDSASTYAVGRGRMKTSASGNTSSPHYPRDLLNRRLEPNDSRPQDQCAGHQRDDLGDTVGVEGWDLDRCTSLVRFP